MLTEDDFILDSCKSTPGFEFYLKKKMKIDIKKLGNLLHNKNYYISKDNAPFYIHFKTKDADISIFSSLKIIIKNIEDETLVKKVLYEVLEIINQIIE
jgi:ArsR family metal-binding transcriptional regulator